MLKVLAFGNPLVDEDRVAIDLAKEIIMPGVIFTECHSLDQALQAARADTVILDVAKGVEEVVLIDDLNKVKARHIYSLHDFDLGYFLRLMQSMGKIDRLRIIALPYGKGKDEVKDKVEELIKSLL